MGVRERLLRNQVQLGKALAEDDGMQLPERSASSFRVLAAANYVTGIIALAQWVARVSAYRNGWLDGYTYIPDGWGK